MKSRFPIRIAPPCMAGTLMFITLTGDAQAGLLYWNPGGTGGDGIWGTTPGDKNWNTVPGAPAGNIFWQDGVDDVAVFDDPLGGIVTVFDTVRTAGIVHSGADYTIEVGSIVLEADSSSNAPFVQVQGGTLSIDSPLDGSDGMVKTGGGTLILAAANSYTGPTVIEGGVVNLTGSLASSALSISSAATLLNQNGGLSSAASLVNGGTLTLNANDMVASYVSNGGTLAAGTGTLSSTTATLNHGSSVAGPLNAVTLTSKGTVSISGTATAGSAAIQSGSLTLGGTLASNSVDISNGASLLNQSGGLSNGATLTNAGSLTMSANDTVDSYISNGGTLAAGAGTLSSRTAALNDGSSVAGRLYADEITSNGAVTMSGIVTGKMSTGVQSGTLNLTGALTTTNLNISSGATLIQNGDIGPSSLGSAVTVVTNSGSLVVKESAVFKAYISNGGLLDIQGGRMITQTITLNDGSITKGGSFSANLLTTNGAVRIENTALGARAIVASGVLDLAGSIGAGNVEIANGASLLNQNGGLSNSADVTNAGSLVLLNADRISTYTSNGGLLDARSGTFGTSRMNLNDGSITRGFASADQLVSQGNVQMEGRIIGNQANIAGGVLSLTGTLGFTNTNIASGATLLNQGGEFSHTISLTNSGTLNLHSDATVRDYISNGGTLTSGPGTLFATSTALNNGSTIEGELNTGTLTSNGSVRSGGVVSADEIRIVTGTLINSGTLGGPSTRLNLNEGATLVAGGIQQYALLSTFGRGAATWSGDLNNPAVIAPGGLGAPGRLDVTGTFSNSQAGVLRMDLSAVQSDYLAVSGDARLGGTLDLNQAAGGAIASFVPVRIIGASSYSGNFATITENLDGSVWFNPGNGTVTRLAFAATGGSSLQGLTANQSAAWISLYDDVVDPGVANITRNSGANPPYDISSGIASAENPDLLWALAASITPGGLDSTLLNRLSPEVYTGFADYATQATRSHQRAALNAPGLPASAPAAPSASKSGLHDAKDAAPSLAKPGVEFFAALDSFHVETENSLNDADYALDGSGIIAGMRGQPHERLTLAGYLAGNDGTVDGALLDADVLGWSIGMTGEWLLDAKTSSSLVGAVSYGSYAFDGERGSASATADGWAAGDVWFSDVGQNSLELFLGLESTVYQDEKFRVIPSAALRYASGFTESFREETQAAAGSPIMLSIDEDRHESALAEVALLGELDWNDRLTLRGQAGANAALIGDDHVLAASFADGGRPMVISAEGLADDLFFLSFGAEYRLTESASIRLDYRGEFRESNHPLHGISVSSSFRF